MAFHILIELLMVRPWENNKDKISIFFPETVFYENGAPRFVATMDRDFCLSTWTDTEDKELQLIQG